MPLEHSPSRDEGQANGAPKRAVQSSPLAHSIDAFSEISNLGRSFLYEEIRNGKLEARKAGRRTIILHDEGQRYLNRKRLPRDAGVLLFVGDCGRDVSRKAATELIQGRKASGFFGVSDRRISKCT